MQISRVSPDTAVYATCAFLTALAALVTYRMGPGAAIAFALVPLFALGAALLLGSGRIALYALAFVLPLSGIKALTDPLPFGGANIRLQDLLVLLALGSWAFALLLDSSHGRERTKVPWTPVLGWPLVAFGLFIVIPLLRGHYAYGASLVGQPLRLVAYAAIAVSLVGMTPERMYRLLLWIFYPGALISLLWGAYYVATGGSQSASVDLSTGGSRPLAISTSLYCAGALFLALFTVRKSPGRAVALPHLGMAGIAMVGVILGFGRGVFAGVAVVLLVLLVVSPGVRRGVLFGLPLAVPFLILISVIVLHTAPNLISSFQHRVSASPSQDANVIWRKRANAVVLDQVREQPVFGVGFGRSSTFYFNVKNSNGFLVPFRQDIGQDPHNGFLFLFAGGGILALGSYLTLIGVFAFDAVRRYRRSETDTERLLIAWAGATLFVFLFEAASGTMFEFPSDLLPIWALIVLPAVVPMRSRPTDAWRRRAR